MSLTLAQLLALQTAVAAEPTLTAARTQGNDGAITAWLNAPSTFVVWNSTTPINIIIDAVNWANYTPPAPLAGAGQDAANWIHHCALKRDQLWAILSMGIGSVSSGKANIRNAIQDAMTGVPAGVSAGVMNGTLIGVGFPAVKTAMQRFATNAEKTFATGTGTATTPGDLVWEGVVGPSDGLPVIDGRVNIWP